MTVKQSEVIDVLGATEFSPSDTQFYIDTAGERYDDLTSDDNVPTAQRDAVVTFYAAHLIRSSAERQLSSGDGVSFEGETGMGLAATTQGQQAQQLDPTGKLASADLPGAALDVPDVK